MPISAHASVASPSGRDALALLQAQDAGRMPELVPIRWGRMSVSPFTFYRGAAAIMAADLAAAPRTSLSVQLCGDAHLSNLGLFQSPDRRLVFDLNDFDETLVGPFEWDVKRLAASVVVAGRATGLSTRQCANAASETVRGYRTAMRRAADVDPLDLWYYRAEFDAVAAGAHRFGKGAVRRMDAAARDAGRKDRLGAFSKLTEVVDGQRRIRERPPLVTRLRPSDLDAELDRVATFFTGYLGTLTEDRAHLLGRYRLTDVAYKVVGVGSVGSRCLIALFESGDGEPLFLQVKQAVASVLEPYLGASTADQSGRRVVEGQRILQSASDVLLGWSRYAGGEGSHDYYVRQLWDGKASAVVEELGPKLLGRYGALCGAVLARAHARSGDPAAISGYIGGGDRFDRALTAFALVYADRNDADHAACVAAIDAGRIEVTRDA